MKLIHNDWHQRISDDLAVFDIDTVQLDKVFLFCLYLQVEFGSNFV